MRGRRGPRRERRRSCALVPEGGGAPAGRGSRRRGSPRGRRGRPRAAGPRCGCGRRRTGRCDRKRARASPRPSAAARRGARGTRRRRRRRRSGARAAARPGPSGGSPRISASCSSVSCSEMTARARLARSPKRRNSVPLPTPASAATASIDTVAGSQRREQLLRRREHLAAVLGGVGALGARFAEQGEGGGHAEVMIANWTVVRLRATVSRIKRTTVRIRARKSTIQ